METIEEKWNNLTQEERDFWADEKKSGRTEHWDMIRRLMEMKKCPMCKKKFPDGLSNFNTVRGDFAFHMETTHGIPREVLLDLLNKIINDEYSSNHSCEGGE